MTLDPIKLLADRPPAGAGASLWDRQHLFRRLMAQAQNPTPTRTRKPPRLDPVKSAAKMIAKNPALVARIKPDGEVEIAAREVASPAANETELDASVGSDVWDAIAAISGGKHGAN